MNERKSKNIVIIALCITLIFMGVGFSLLSQELTINGSATVTSVWDVQITNAEATSGMAKGAAIEADALTTLTDALVVTPASVTFNTELAEPGDYVVYTVTVKNAGTINAAVDTIVETLERAENEVNEPIKYTLAGIDEGDSLTSGGTEVTFTVTATYDSSFTGAKAPAPQVDGAANPVLSRDYTAVITYEQAD